MARNFQLTPKPRRTALAPVHIDGRPYYPKQLGDGDSRAQVLRKLTAIQIRLNVAGGHAAKHRERFEELCEAEFENLFGGDGGVREADADAKLAQIRADMVPVRELERRADALSLPLISEALFLLLANPDNELRDAVAAADTEAAGVLGDVVRELRARIFGLEDSAEAAAAEVAVAEGADPTVPTSSPASSPPALSELG